MMQINPDERWAALGYENFQFFKEKAIPKIYLKNEVPIDVKKKFKIIEKLLQHSYYEYEFYGIAATQALLAFEMALKQQYHFLTGDKWSRKIKKEETPRNLKNLIEWFFTRTYFEAVEAPLYSQIREIRNYIAHPESYTFAGPMMRHWIETPIDLINDLYENRDLRLIRLTVKDIINEFLRETLTRNDNGGIITIDDMSFIIYDAGVVFYDNTKSIPTLRLYFKEIFDLSLPLSQQKAKAHSLDCHNYEIDELNDSITFFSDGFKKIQIRSNTKEINKVKYEKWLADFHANKEVQISEHLLNQNIYNDHLKLRREMHYNSDF